MLLGQEAFLAPDLRRETTAGGWWGCNELAQPVNSWSRGRLIFRVYTRDEVVESLAHQQPPKYTAEFQSTEFVTFGVPF